jgi:hypothetical protein
MASTTRGWIWNARELSCYTLQRINLNPCIAGSSKTKGFCAPHLPFVRVDLWMAITTRGRFRATVQFCDRTNNIRFMTKLNVFYTIWFWSSLVCKLILNKGFLWSGCCVCEHTLNHVVFHHKSSFCVFTLRFSTWFCNGMWFLYYFVAMFFPSLLYCIHS